jgi:hypothetical protein
MVQRDRRAFLADVGRGVVAASIGASLASDLGFPTAFADEGTERLNFGPLEPLVALMQETPPARLIPAVVERLRQGTPLRDVVAAAAYANARTFGGEDYVGFHTMMAIPASFQMSAELPEARRAMPVLKVLYRNANRIQEQGGPRNEILRPVQAAPLPTDRPGAEALREACRARDVNRAEGLFATLASTSADDAFNSALVALEDGADVHRVVLPYRAWDLMGIIGREHAHTLLRQSIRYNVRQESPQYVRHISSIRTLIPRLLDQHRLPGREAGTRQADDAWIERMADTIFRGTPEQAAEAAAAALAEGMNPDAVGEAFCLAANQLVLRDNGRTQAQASPGKPVGSVHGDSIGVHACDSANAWRNLARAANPRNKAVCLILGAWQVARDRGSPAFVSQLPYPREDAQAGVRDLGRDVLLRTLDDAIKANDQARAAAIAQRYVQLDLPVRPVWDLLLSYAISEDGALHAEKYYRTATAEYAASRAAFRSRQLVALARVTASAYGHAAPGHADACRLLGV